MYETCVVDKQYEDTNNNLELNKSIYFVLPMLGRPLDYYYNLLNTYLGDINDKNNDIGYLYILLEDFDNRLLDTKGYIYVRKAPPHGVLYKFKIDYEYYDDYIKFIEGRYSEFSINYKNQLYKLLPKPFKNSIVYKVITKSKELKKIIEDKVGQSIGDQEVMSKPNLTKELYSDE